MLKTDVTEGNRAVMTDTTENDGQKIARATGALLQARGLTVRARGDVRLLSDISFHIEPGELVALTGLSRSGKTTLLESLAGNLPPASGEILLDGVSLYANLKAFGPAIGYVPADYALHQNLTVAEVMQDAAILRLPRRISEAARSERIRSVLETVGLAEVTGSRVSSLSRFEKRKLGIAVELMSSPKLLLVDESAEQLTPFEEIQITTLLRDLCRQGLTILQADQRSRSAGLSDQVIFLVPGGMLAWFGPADEGFTYLRRLVPRGVVKDLFGLKEALEILANPQAQEGVEWAKRFKTDPSYQKYVDDPLDNKFPDLLLETRPLIRLRLRGSAQEKLPPPIVPRASLLQQFMLFIWRNFRLLRRDKTALLMLAVPPLIALLELAFSAGLRTDPGLAPFALGIQVFLAILTAVVLFQSEISKERAIYQRESRTASVSIGYILSKVWLAGILAVYQGLVWTAIHFLSTGFAGGTQSLISYAVTLFLVTFIGGIIGLIVSTVSRTPVGITGWLLLLTIPQLILDGSLVPAGSLGFPFNMLSRINPSRYAYEALLAIQGFQAGLSGMPLSSWVVLAAMSLGLILVLLVVQRSTADDRI